MNLKDHTVTLKHFAIALKDRALHLKNAVITLKLCTVAAKDRDNTLKLQRRHETLCGEPSKVLRLNAALAVVIIRGRGPIQHRTLSNVKVHDGDLLCSDFDLLERSEWVKFLTEGCLRTA